MSFRDWLSDVFHFVEAEDFNDQSRRMDILKQDNNHLKYERECVERMYSRVPFLLNLNNATIKASAKDKNNDYVFLCFGKDGKDSFLFLLNHQILKDCAGNGYTSYPYIEWNATNTQNKIEIIRFYCNVGYQCSETELYSCENKGYGTILFNQFLNVAKEQYGSNSCKVWGMLSDVDAKTEKTKQRRNNFYRNKGFQMNFRDEEEKNGIFSAQLSDLWNLMEEKLSSFSNNMSIEK